MIEPRHFGTTGIQVSAIGFGAGHIGDASLTDKEAGALLNAVLDAGIHLIDTARGYGASEERIGRHLAHRRDDFVLSTKVGYGIPGFEDWTHGCVLAGVHAALRLLQTDRIDIVHLHSCPLETLQRGEVIDALDELVAQGLIRVAAYSGDHTPLAHAVSSGRFRAMQTSLNICDQRVIDHPLPQAKERGMGVIAKRPVANAPWRFGARPVGHYAEEYWVRWKTMNVDIGMDWQEAALRFAAFTYGVDTCIVGTTNLDHLRQNIAAVAKGILPAEVVARLRSAFRQHDHHWIGQV